MLTKTKACRCITASLIALTAAAAHGEEARQPAFTTQPLSQTVYKGVVGNLLDEMPLDAEHRHDLQRGSAVISSTLSGRSLALVLGVANPLLMAVGLAWGLFAASQIEKSPATPILAGPLCRDADPDILPAATLSPDDSLALKR